MLVLAYHNIVPDKLPPSGDRSLHLPLDAFRRQLDLVTRVASVVPVREALAGPGGRRPRVAISFDDAYAGAVELGLPELARRGLPATMFVAPGCLGADGFWWDRFAPESGWPTDLRDQLLTTHGGLESSVRAWAAQAGLPGQTTSPWHRVATEDEIRSRTHAGLEIGTHSWSHPNLAALDGAWLDQELVRPLEWLRERFDSTLPWLAYPYGIASSPVAAAAQRAGYEAALLVDGGWIPARASDPFLLPRWNVPAGISLGGFRLRLAGLFCQ